MTWPAVFNGIGALVVRCDNDPDVLADRITGLSYIAPKVNGSDIAADTETLHAVARWRARGLAVGCWVYCGGPPEQDVADGKLLVDQPAFVVYDVEAEYKADEDGTYAWAAELVAGHHRQRPGVPAAVTSYGGYKPTIDFGAFAAAGWPILAQCYDAFGPGDEVTYYELHGGVYPNPTKANGVGVHRLVRSLELSAGQAVYRPESTD